MLTASPASFSPLESRSCGVLSSGGKVQAFTLRSPAGLEVEILSWGGIVSRLLVPDRNGRLADVVLGFTDLEKYFEPHPYFGAIVGRIAGRVTDARLELDGEIHALTPNISPHHLHGGKTGFDKRLWNADAGLDEAGNPSLRLEYFSPEGEERYPGNVSAAVTYSVSAENQLIIDSEARTDRLTALSLTHHSYFNLAGESSGPATEHRLEIFAASSALADEKMVLLDQRAAVTEENDFRHSRLLCEAIPRLHQQHGDLYFLERAAAGEFLVAARLTEPASARVMTVWTDENCLQFYSGAAFDGTIIGKSGKPYGRNAGVCLECEGYPNGVSRPDLGGEILLRPGEIQRRRTIYAFSIQPSA